MRSHPNIRCSASIPDRRMTAAVPRASKDGYSPLTVQTSENPIWRLGPRTPLTRAATSNSDVRANVEQQLVPKMRWGRVGRRDGRSCERALDRTPGAHPERQPAARRDRRSIAQKRPRKPRYCPACSGGELQTKALAAQIARVFDAGRRVGRSLNLPCTERTVARAWAESRPPPTRDCPA
jgi:hypothetical protein